MAILIARNLLVLGFAVSLATAAELGGEIVVLEPGEPIEGIWRHSGCGRKTEYSRVETGGVAAIRAVGRSSASGLHRELRIHPADYPWLEWTWRVDKLQERADIRDANSDDFGAAIFLLFGRPSLLRRHVPTLSYVWTNDRLRVGEIVLSPHHPGTSRSIVLQAGTQRLGHWLRERRNIVEDYRRAFGADPPGTLEAIALWTDNDQTGEPVEAHYGRMVMQSK